MYSFEVVLMEAFTGKTGKKPTDGMLCGKMSLRSWVKKNVHCCLLEAVDSRLMERVEEHKKCREMCDSHLRVGLGLFG